MSVSAMTFRLVAALAAVFAPVLALAASTDSGTGAVGEMTLTPAQLGMLLGAAVVLGILIWLVIKFLNKK